MKTVYDTILWLTSKKTGRRFPIAQFSADTDMATSGWVSLTSPDNHDIVVTQMTDDEFNASLTEADDFSLLETRVKRALDRNDLICSCLMKVVEPTAGADFAALSFQEYRKVRQRPRLLYRDIYNPASFATVSGELPRREFEREGGKLVVLT